MTNKEILQKAIEKAEKNKYKYFWAYESYCTYSKEACANTDKYIKIVCPSHLNHPEIIIFSHEFAKAFWGNSSCIKCGGTSLTGHQKLCNNQKMKLLKSNCWQYHLQQMILEENPLKYIEKFLGE